MKIMAIALGGCLTGEPAYGITEDTGGHITYILGAMRALASRDDVDSAEIVTRWFADKNLGPLYACPREVLGPKLHIIRVDSGNPAYLTKDELAQDRSAFTAALIADLRQRDSLPDIVHAHFADAAQVADELRREFGIPFIYTAHSLGIDKVAAGMCGRDRLTSRIALERQAMERADAIIGSSRDECERQIPAYQAAKPGITHRVRPGIEQISASPAEIADAQALIRPFLRNLSKPIILAIARPVRKKNLAALVEAYASHERLIAEANLVILPGLRQSIGTGEAEQVEVMRELAELIDQHDLYGSVAYPRRHTQGQVRGLYMMTRRAHGVFVNPALVEPFGLTILEAAAYGLPVVATCHGGPVDIIGELEHGILVDPRNHGAIANAIAQIMHDPMRWQAFSNNASARVRAMNWNTYATNFRAIAQSVITRGRDFATRPTRKQLLICDIDDTLTGCRVSALEFSRFIVENPTLTFGVATGRSLVEAQRLIREWGLPVPEVFITSVGSEIYWNRGQGLQLDDDFADEIGSDWQVEAIEMSMNKVAGIDPQLSIEQRQFKRSYFANRQEINAVQDALQDAGCAARVIFSHDRLLDILPKAAGKYAAVQHVARALGIPSSRVIVAGDSGNDLDMINHAANSIVVANAEPEVLAIADQPNVMLASQPYAAGVLEMLRTYLSSRQSSGGLHHTGEAA